MSLNLTHETNQVETERRTEEFGTQDNRRRWIGARVVAWEFDLVPTDQGYGYQLAPGHYYGANIHATRDGKPYGASQARAFFTTAAERDAHIAKRIESSRKRAAKLGAKA